MLSNEQRAHDIAILMTEYSLKNPVGVECAGVESSVENDSINVTFDVSAAYIDFYKLAFNAMTKEFPE